MIPRRKKGHGLSLIHIGYYPTARFKALITNYYEEHQGRLYEILNQEEEKDDAADQPDPGE